MLQEVMNMFEIVVFLPCYLDMTDGFYWLGEISISRRLSFAFCEIIFSLFAREG